MSEIDVKVITTTAALPVGNWVGASALGISHVMIC